MFRIDRASVGIREGEAKVLPTKPVAVLPPPPEPEEIPLDEPEIIAPPPGEQPEEVLSRARQQAADIIDNANKEAQDVVQQAYIQSDSIKNDAWQEGAQRGREEGEASAQAVYAEEVNILATMIDRLSQLRQSVIDDIAAEVLSLSMDIAQKILLIELELNNEAFFTVIKGAISNLKATGKVTLHVSPAEYQRFFKGDSAYNLDTDTIKVTAVEDDTLEPYGCVIDADTGSINAGVMAQLRAAAKALE